MEVGKGLERNNYCLAASLKPHETVTRCTRAVHEKCMFGVVGVSVKWPKCVFIR